MMRHPQNYGHPKSARLVDVGERRAQLLAPVSDAMDSGHVGMVKTAT